MLRTRAVLSLVTEEIAGLTPRTATAEDEPAAVYLQALDEASRRCRLVIGLDWAAIATLFILRDRTTAFLQLGASQQTVFTLAVLAVAVHSGFRLGQLFLYQNVRRTCAELGER